jgi:acetyltransferase-like isoleucine patch superfamily enzyme
MDAQKLREIFTALTTGMRSKFNRHVSFGDLISDRWETAKRYGFGEGASCYDNVLILGDVKVGRHTWVGPNVVLDGSGGLEIGDYCSISAGVQIYSHHTVKWATSLGHAPIDRAPVKIGSGVYIGPNSVIQMGISIGDKAVIGAMSFVNQDIPANVMAFGIPAKPQRTPPL